MNSSGEVEYLPEKKTVSTNETQQEKIITLEATLLTGEPITLSGTAAEIIKIRAELVAAGKLPNYIDFDDEAKRNLLESKDMTRWIYTGDSKNIIDTFAEKEKIAEDKKKREKLVRDMKESVTDGTLYVTKSINHSKNALFNILIVSEEKLKYLMSKKGLNEAGNTIGTIIEKGIEYTIPQLQGTLPHFKNTIYMTGQQLIDIITRTLPGKKSKSKQQ